MDELADEDFEEDEQDLETTDVSSPEEEEEVETEEEPSEPEPSRRRELLKSALLILRDVGVALLVVLIVFLILWAYSGVWPPIVVVESSSMQHDDFTSSVGVIDTGDLVLVQHTNSPKEIESFVHGQCSGHSTYGDEGDVIIYNELGGGDKPIIHRVLVWLKYNETNNSFDVPDLECEKWVNGVNWWATNYNGTGPPITITEPLNINSTLKIHVVSAYRNGDVDLNIRNYLDNINADDEWTDGGFVTLGDNNNIADRTLIKHDWIVGKARGELPWFGLIKLSVTGEIPWGEVCSSDLDKKCATQNSWDSLVIALVILIVVPIALDIGLGFYQKWKRKRASESEEEEPIEGEETTESPPEEDEEMGAEEEPSEDAAEELEEPL